MAAGQVKTLPPEGVLEVSVSGPAKAIELGGAYVIVQCAVRLSVASVKVTVAVPEPLEGGVYVTEVPDVAEIEPAPDRPIVRLAEEPVRVALIVAVVLPSTTVAVVGEQVSDGLAEAEYVNDAARTCWVVSSELVGREFAVVL